MLKVKLLVVLLMLLNGFVVKAKEPVVSEAVWIVKIAPAYPRKALMAQIEGWVTIVMSINQQGSVDKVEVTDAEPHRIFDESAIAAGMKFKFKPKTIDGVAVPSKARITLHFDLPETEAVDENAALERQP